MRVVVTGAGGQLGTDLTRAMAGWEVIPLNRDQLADREQILQVVTTTEPDAIVHAGAWTAVDDCESDPEKAFRSNALASRHVAEAARLVGAHVLYVSTDYVFDGTATTPYNEWDAPNPQSVYGRSKLAGEREVLAQLPSAAVVRTGWVCGAHGNNMVKTILRLASEHERLTFVDDQHGCPTFTADLAHMIRRLVVSRLPGLFHVTNQGPTTWFEFARAVLAASGQDPERVSPVSTADFARPAPRPAFSVLDNAALRLQGIPLLDDWRIPMERTVKELSA
ncbi:MAG TPA: dTDP-4-dehydrorhamnose reductase [Acidimicrobiales bacterium]|nr:dTDP-4-dehydrorhamnose reductase [Acidimicrobiales bacterium]